MMVRNLIFGLVAAFIVAAIVAPDALVSAFTGEPTQLVNSKCPPDQAKQGKKVCLQGPFAGTKVEDRVSDAIGKFDDE